MLLSGLSLAIFALHQDATSVWGIAVLGPIPGLLIGRRHGLAGFLTYIGVYIGAAAAFTAIGEFALIQSIQLSVYRSLVFDESSDNGWSAGQIAPAIWLTLATLGAPALIAIASSTYALARRKPVGSIVLLALTAVLPPIVCVLAIAYGALGHIALCANARLIAQNHQAVADERQIVVHLAGKPWPAR